MSKKTKKKLKKLMAELNEMEKEMRKIDEAQTLVSRKIGALKKSSDGYSSSLKGISSRTKNFRIEGFDG